jgi:hypothetical protein
MLGQRRPRSLRRRGRRLLLVGPTVPTTRALEAPLSALGELLVVPFPGPAFDRAVTGYAADLVVVDVTYLDEARVRPLILHRFETARPMVVFVSETGEGWWDDLHARTSGPMTATDPEAICDLVAGPTLRVAGS